MAIEWTQYRLGPGSVATLAPVLKITVWQNIGTRHGTEPKWRAEVFGATLKAEFAAMDEAKAAAERFARKQIAIAVTAVS